MLHGHSEHTAVYDVMYGRWRYGQAKYDSEHDTWFYISDFMHGEKKTLFNVE